MATRFRFRLEPLLKLRKSLEQEAQRHLAKMMEARNSVEAHLQGLKRQQHDARAQATTLKAEGLEKTYGKRKVVRGVVFEIHLPPDAADIALLGGRQRMQVRLAHATGSSHASRQAGAIRPSVAVSPTANTGSAAGASA